MCSDTFLGKGGVGWQVAADQTTVFCFWVTCFHSPSLKKVLLDNLDLPQPGKEHKGKAKILFAFAYIYVEFGVLLTSFLSCVLRRCKVLGLPYVVLQIDKLQFSL